MSREMLRRGAVALAILLAAMSGALASPLPGCAAHIEVAGAVVARVESDGVLVLHDGRAAAMEGVLLPRGRRDHAPEFPVREALTAVRDMADGHRATLALEHPRLDRYGRLRAQIFFPDEQPQSWLQLMLIRRGLARVDITPARSECAPTLYRAESRARAAHLGIWALQAYAVRKPGNLKGDVGTFQIVEGTVQSAALRGGRVYLNFGKDWRTDFTATISPDDMKLFRKAGIDPRRFAGKRVRVRGWIEAMNGPEIELSSPEQIEMVR